ncbi:MAG: hypothetical protein R3288_10560 [Woeseiaceae bacterium]|nr:hypothetical protein [Woeseiaceae bacterium]
MKRTCFAAFALGFLPGIALSSDTSVIDDTLARYIGTWDMDLMTHTETFGEHGGPGKGTMACDWGPMKAWVDCVMESEYDGLGRYALKIVLHRTSADDTIGAFVTNSFGGGRLYLGRWQNATDLVFYDAWIDPNKKWEHQVTTYTFVDNDTIRYRIDVSDDNESFYPHSSGTYSKRQPQFGHDGR